MQAFIPKEMPDIPDAYGVELSIFGGKPINLEIVSHRIVDKIYDKGNYLGINPSPFWEFQIRENDELFCVPVSSCSIKFDSRWFKICDLIKKQNDNKASKGS